MTRSVRNRGCESRNAIPPGRSIEDARGESRSGFFSGISYATPSFGGFTLQ